MRTFTQMVQGLRVVAWPTAALSLSCGCALSPGSQAAQIDGLSTPHGLYQTLVTAVNHGLTKTTASELTFADLYKQWLGEASNAPAIIAGVQIRGVRDFLLANGATYAALDEQFGSVASYLTSNHIQTNAVPPESVFTQSALTTLRLFETASDAAVITPAALALADDDSMHGPAFNAMQDIPGNSGPTGYTRCPPNSNLAILWGSVAANPTPFQQYLNDLQALPGADPSKDSWSAEDSYGNRVTYKEPTPDSCSYTITDSQRNAFRVKVKAGKAEVVIDQLTLPRTQISGYTRPSSDANSADNPGRMDSQ